MASSSKHSSSPVHTLSNNYDSEESDIALLAAQREELDRSFKEFSANFIKQQEIIGGEIKELRFEMIRLRQNTRRDLRGA